MRCRMPMVLLATFFLALSVVARAQNTSMNDDERSAAADLLQATNQDRSSQGLEPLHPDPALTKAAWEHAQRMVASGTLSHQLPGEPDIIVRVQQVGLHCSTVAENVAEAPTAGQINEEWMHSPAASREPAGSASEYGWYRDCATSWRTVCGGRFCSRGSVDVAPAAGTASRFATGAAWHSRAAGRCAGRELLRWHPEAERARCPRWWCGIAPWI